MPSRRRTVTQLAREAQVDPEDALIVLWDSGFPELQTVRDSIGRRDLNRARRALSIPTRRELKDPLYWEAVFDVNRDGLTALLADVGVQLSPNSTSLPKGAVSRLKARAPQALDVQALDVVDLPPTVDGSRAPIVPPLQWEPPGHEADLDFLNEQDVLDIHYAIVEDVADSGDPIDPAGPRSEALLGGAVFRPQTSLGNHFKYSTIESSAAALLHSLVLDHPFHNGNKRTGLVAYMVFLDRNGVVLTCDETALFSMVLRLAKRVIVDRHFAQRADREVHAVAEWTCENSRLSEKGDHPIAWRKLRRILLDYGCVFEKATVGNRLNISRTTTVDTGWKGHSREKVYRTQVYHADDGRDAHVEVLKKIRRDLALDYAHGVDAQAFYGKHPEVAADFIARYRSTLDRLARL